MKIGYLLKNIIKESAIYALGPTLHAGVAFFLIPVYTKHLLPSEYGILEFILAIGVFITPIIDAGLTSSFWKYGIGDNENNREVVLSNILISKLIVSIIICAIIYVFSILNNNYTIKLIFLYSIVLIGQTILHFIFLEFQSAHKVKLYVLLSFINALAIAFANIVLVTNYRMGITGVILGNIFGVFFSCLVFLPFYIKSFDFSIDFKLLKNLYVYGFPLVFGNLAYLITSTSDRFFINQLSSTNDLGLYAYGNKLASLLNIFIITPFFLGFNPIRWEIYKQDDSKEIFSNLFTFLFSLLGISYFVFTIGGIFIGKILAKNPEYIPGLSVTPLKTFSFLLYGLYYYRSMGLLFEKKTHLISVITMISAGINIILNIILITRIGYVGAGISSVFSYFVMYVLAAWLSQKYYRVKYDIKIEVVGLLVISLYCYVIILTEFKGFINTIALGFAMVVIFFITSIWGIKYKFFQFVKILIKKLCFFISKN